MSRRRPVETIVHWVLIGLTVVMMAMATRDAWNRIGRPWPGFPVMENMLVGVAGVDRMGLSPFDVVRAVNGRLVTSTRELQAEIERHPPGTTMHYLLVRNGQLLEDDIPTRVNTLRNFKRFLIENLMPGVIGVALAAIVLGAVADGKVSLIAGVTQDLTGKVKAGELVNFVAQQVGGKGGGRPDMAQAGGTEPAKLPAALQSVKAWVEQRV